ncbi:hypothetical protein LIER_19733 [Lithospermum erythrorhizon]|uniref:Retrovirus-related Pol polyprotein from transposon TNT 1-94-like beta-barrel domain-containing protein n=1 Tax=Lithospermum erythrorhizon TaxID=34254 RepID=A0AAV3QLH9_LITER
MFKVNKKSFGIAKKDRACFHYGKPGHYISECMYRNANCGNEGMNRRNVTNMVTNNNKQEVYVAMVTEVNMTTVESQSSWWLDSGTTIYVCNNKVMFKTLKDVDAQEDVMMGNNPGAKVLGKGVVDLEFTYGKKLSLLNLFYVPSVRKNLISANLLCKNRFKLV